MTLGEREGERGGRGRGREGGMETTDYGPHI